MKSVMKLVIVACLAVAAAEWWDDNSEYRRERVAATEFKAKVAPYLVEAPEL